MSKNFRRLSVLFSVPFLLASCGGSADVGKEVTIGSSTFQCEVSSMVIGMECNYAPFNWSEARSNEFTLPVSTGGFADGYDIQISKRLSSIMGMDVTIVREAWESLVEDCKMDNINMILAGMTDTQERRQSVSFTNEYYHSEVVLMTSDTVAAQYDGQVLGTAELTTLLKNQIIVSQANTVEDDVIDTFVSSYGAKHGSPLPTYGLAAEDVHNGSAFGLTVELPVAKAYMSSMDHLGIIHLNQDILGVDLSTLGVSIGIKKENNQFREALNAALEQISLEDRDSLMDAAVNRSSGI